MKAKSVLALLLTLTVGLTAFSGLGFSSAAAAEDSLVILDTSKRASITKAGFKADTKTVKEGSEYSAKWVVDDAGDIKIANAPTDLSDYGTVSFSIRSESSEDAVVMVYFGSENSATDGIDYYSYVMTLKPGVWQDVSIDLTQLKPNRTPLGWDNLSEISFRTIGWNNKAAAGTEIYIENVVASGTGAGTSTPTASPSPAPGAGEEDESSLTKVFYYNNFDDADAGIQTGASAQQKSNSITHGFDSGDNGFVRIEVTGDTDDCYFEASLKSTKVNNLVVEMDLSTDGDAPSGNLQYKDSPDRKQGTPFSFENNEIKIGDNVVAELEKGTWTKLGFLFDFSKLQYTAYVDGEEVGTFDAAQTNNDLQIMRLYVNKSTQNVGKTLLLDNFAVYGGTEFRDVSSEYVPPAEEPSTSGSAIVAKAGEDVAMQHPSIDEIGNGVALMLDIPDAYARGQRTKVDTENDAVVPFTVNDRTLVPVRFISESFDAQVDWDEAAMKATVTSGDNTIELVIGSDQMLVNGEAQTLEAAAMQVNDRSMLPLRALVEALGKNVLWDERGLIVITDPEIVLDPVEDVKLSTMLIGLLKNGIEASNYAAAPSFTQDIIDEACASDCGSWSSSSGNSNSGEKSANIIYYLTLAARFDPDAAATDGTLCKDAALKQVRHLIAGGNEPFACVGCYWGHAVVASALLLVKNTPVVYDELTADEKDRMDWLMRGLAIAGNWGFNDANDYRTGFDLMGNFGKGWNPNYRNTYLSIVLSASMYFGAEELDEIFTSFDYDTYIDKYTELGFTNILATWTVAGKDLMENGGECTLLGGIGLSYMEEGESGGTGKGVKIPFLYNGRGPGEIEYLFKNLVDFTYAWEVLSDYGTPGTDGYAYILSGKKSPFEGQMGMMREFAGSDGGSADGTGSNIRSRCGYGYDSYEILNTVYANMKLLGYWDSSTDEMQKLDNRIYVGNEDLLFKMQEGYHGYSSGKGSDEFEYNYLSRGHKFVKDMWRNFHCMLDEEVTVAKDPNAIELEDIPEAEPMNGITEAPEGAYKSVMLGSSSNFVPESFYKLDKSYTKGTAEFDVVVGPTVALDEFDCVIMLDKQQEDITWQNVNMPIQFKGGTINVRNKDTYLPTMQYDANYRFHFKVEFDVAARKHTVSITQIYPTQGETVVFEDMDFRGGANEIDAVDSLVIVQSTNNSNLWVENFQITQ